jgi:hypothetical protein
MDDFVLIIWARGASQKASLLGFQKNALYRHGGVTSLARQQASTQVGPVCGMVWA